MNQQPQSPEPSEFVVKDLTNPEQPIALVLSTSMLLVFLDSAKKENKKIVIHALGEQLVEWDFSAKT